MSNTSLNLSEETLEELQELGEHFNKDINEIVTEIVEGIGNKSGRIIHQSEEYKVPVTLTALLMHTFDTASMSTNYLFNDLLGELDAKGYYVLEYMESELDEPRIMVQFDSLEGSPLLVSYFVVELESHMWSVRAVSYIEVDESNLDGVSKMRKLVECRDFDDMVPEDFYEVDYWTVEDESGEEYVSLVLNMNSEALSYLPSIPTMSSFFEKIYEKAGIKPTNPHTS